MATAVGKIKFRHQTAIANNPAYDVSANVFNDSFVTGADVATDLGVDGDVMVRDSAQADGWGWQTVAGLVTPVTPAEGGTGIVSYTAGDMLYASGTTTLAKLAIVAAGQVLVSGTSPAWSANPSLTSVTLSSFVQTPTITRGADSTLSIQVNSAARWAFDNSTGAGSGGVYSLYPAVDATYDLGSATNRVGTGYFGTSIATPVLRSLSGNLNLRAAGATAIVFNVNGADVVTFNGVEFTPTDATVALGDATHRFTSAFLGTAVAVGTNPSSTGAVRLKHAAQINGRDSTNVTNVILLDWGSTTDTVQIGQSGFDLILAGSSVKIPNGYVSVGTSPATTGDWRAQSAFTFKARNAANSADGTILSTDAQDKTVLGGVTSSVADSTAISLGATPIGVLVVVNQSTGTAAMFLVEGAGHAVVLINDPAAAYSVTAGTAGRTNVYWSAGNSRYEVENKTGSTRILQVTLLGTN